MAYPATIAQIETHAKAAGASLPNPITDVTIAYPAPPGRCVRIFYGGEVSPAALGADESLASKMVGQQTVIAGFWPLSNLRESQAKVIETEVQAFVHALRTALLADSQLNGSDSDLKMEFAVPGFADIDGTPYRTVEAVVITDFTEYTIAA